MMNKQKISYKYFPYVCVTIGLACALIIYSLSFFIENIINFIKVSTSFACIGLIIGSIISIVTRTTFAKENFYVVKGDITHNILAGIITGLFFFALFYLGVFDVLPYSSYVLAVVACVFLFFVFGSSSFRFSSKHSLIITICLTISVNIFIILIILFYFHEKIMDCYYLNSSLPIFMVFASISYLYGRTKIYKKIFYEKNKDLIKANQLYYNLSDKITQTITFLQDKINESIHAHNTQWLSALKCLHAEIKDFKKEFDTHKNTVDQLERKEAPETIKLIEQYKDIFKSLFSQAKIMGESPEEHVSPTKKEKNYYEILCIPKNAIQEEIKRAYYELIRQYHPDKIRNYDEQPLWVKQKAKEESIKLNIAYETLKNPAKKEQYDNSL